MNSMSQRKNRWELHTSRTVQIPPFFSTSAITESPPIEAWIPERLEERDPLGSPSPDSPDKEDTHSLMKSHEDITAGLP